MATVTEDGIKQTTATYNKGDHADAMSSLIVMAMQCDVTRIITYMLEDERSEFTCDHVTKRKFTADGSTQTSGTCPEYQQAPAARFPLHRDEQGVRHGRDRLWREPDRRPDLGDRRNRRLIAGVAPNGARRVDPARPAGSRSAAPFPAFPAQVLSWLKSRLRVVVLAQSVTGSCRRFATRCF
jgi:hypothetical protein